MSISHLLFADDLLLVGRTDKKIVLSFTRVMQKFFKVPGQKTKEEENRLILSPNRPSEVKKEVQRILGVSENTKLEAYVGLPISHKRPKRKEV